DESVMMGYQRGDHRSQIGRVLIDDFSVWEPCLPGCPCPKDVRQRCGCQEHCKSNHQRPDHSPARHKITSITATPSATPKHQFRTRRAVTERVAVRPCSTCHCRPASILGSLSMARPAP